MNTDQHKAERAKRNTEMATRRRGGEKSAGWKHEAIDRASMEMEVRVADGVDRNFLPRSRGLSRITVEETEELHKSVLPEMFGQVVGQSVMIVLVVGGFVVRVRDPQLNHVRHLFRIRAVHIAEPATAAVGYLEAGAVRQREFVGDGGVFWGNRVQGRAGLMWELWHECGRGLGRDERHEAHARSMGRGGSVVKSFGSGDVTGEAES